MPLSEFEIILSDDEVFQDALDIETNNNEIKVKKLKEPLNDKTVIKEQNTEDLNKNLVDKSEIKNELKEDEIKKDILVEKTKHIIENDKSNVKEDIKENVKEDVKIEKTEEVIEAKENEIKKSSEELNEKLIEIIQDVKINKKDDKNGSRSKLNGSCKSLNFKDIQIKIEPSLQKLRIADKEKELTFEECLENGRQMMIKFLDNQFEEVIGILEDQSDISIIHKLGFAAVRFFDSILSMDKEKMSIALVAMREASDYADRHRKKTSYLNYLISPDYNTYSDVEAHAELCFATSQLVSGLLIALEDQSGLKIRMAYSSFKECYNILQNKLSWDSNIARMHFESGTRLGIGSFDLIISFFPTKLAKLLEYIGFHSDRDLAVEELTQAVNLVDGLYYDISSILLSAYYGFLEYFYGLGQSDTDFFDKSSIIWHTRTPNSSVVRIGYGVREMMVGQPDKAIKYFKECIDGQSFWIQLHYACWWEITWCYIMKSDWTNAVIYAEKLKNECKWSPAMFTYLYAAFLFMEMEKNNKQKELADKISEELKKIPKLKRKLGGKKAFHEKIVLDRSKKFHNNVHNLLLPHLELLYIWNVFHMMSKEPKLLLPMLNDVENKLKIHKKSNDSNKCLDQYCYLIFMKGVLKRHLGEKKEAVKLFEEVISCKKRIKEEIHLLPQSYFELGMIYRDLDRISEAKKHLKKARDDYSNYLSECMINFRVVNALDLIKKEKENAIKE